MQEVSGLDEAHSEDQAYGRAAQRGAEKDESSSQEYEKSAAQRVKDFNTA